MTPVRVVVRRPVSEQALEVVFVRPLMAKRSGQRARKGRERWYGR